MKAALLFYIKFVKSLLSIGFDLNPYDPCVANKTVENLQLTVVWHVDDLKVIDVLTAGTAEGAVEVAYHTHQFLPIVFVWFNDSCRKKRNCGGNVRACSFSIK